MDESILNFVQKLPIKTPQDVVALAEAYSLKTLHYVSILQQERLVQIIERWPLMAEVMNTQRN